MRKLFTLIAALMLYTSAQAQQVSCYELADLVTTKGYYQASDSFYSSSALSSITWYEVDGNYYALVQFTSSYTKYVYGGFSSYYDYSKVRNYIKNADSAGRAFHNSLGQYQLSCY